jgi:hypothetical protein
LRRAKEGDDHYNGDNDHDCSNYNASDIRTGSYNYSSHNDEHCTNDYIDINDDYYTSDYNYYTSDYDYYTRDYDSCNEPTIGCYRDFDYSGNYIHDTQDEKSLQRKGKLF